MIEQRIFLLVLITSIPVKVLMQSDEIGNQCPIEDRVNLTEGTLDLETGLMVQSGYVFPPESRWIENDNIFGCVCYNKLKCLPRFCFLEKSIYLLIELDCKMEPKNLMPLIYSVDAPIRSLSMNHRNIYTEICMWMESGSKNISSIYNFDISCQCFDDVVTYRPECSNKMFGVSKKIRDIIHNVGIILSIPFLIITFIVYTILPEMKNIHGYTLRGYVSCFSVAIITLAIVRTVDPISDVPCLFIAFTAYFSMIASFFWLNVMCFDIWRTFGNFRSVRAGSVEQYDRKKFLMYSLYAFGCPTVLTGICLIMDFVPGIPDNLIRPELGTNIRGCLFQTDKAQALYYFGPVGVTIICNIFFFTLTVVKIIRHNKDTARNLEGVDSRRHDDSKQWFNLYLKLFVVMGINWISEIIGWLLPDLKHIWAITTLVNELQGLIIFVIFICKKNIIQLLIKRFGCKIPNCLSRNTTRSVRTSSNPTGTTSIPHSD